MKTKFLLAIDIGNTNIVLGVFKGSRLLSKKYIPTPDAGVPARLRKKLNAIPHIKKVDAIIISSVVPAALKGLKKCARRLRPGKVFVLGENIKAPIKNRYRKPRQVGQDRLANGVAVYKRYKGGIVGTAVTFDYISRKNEYLGGIIFPGLRLSLENLSLKAALLPKIRLKRAKSLLGKDTAASMQSGILNGYASLCDGIVNKLKSRYGRGLVVIATGGDARLLRQYCSSIDKIDLDLTLKGLLITYLKK